MYDDDLLKILTYKINCDWYMVFMGKTYCSNENRLQLVLILIVLFFDYHSIAVAVYIDK